MASPSHSRANGDATRPALGSVSRPVGQDGGPRVAFQTQTARAGHSSGLQGPELWIGASLPQKGWQSTPFFTMNGISGPQGWGLPHVH